MERQEATELKHIFPGHRYRYEFACRRVKGRVLDAACGVGYGTRMLHDAGHRVVGVDIERSAIETAEEHYRGPGFICADIASAPWAGHFDWVVCFETVEHIPNPVEVLKRFRASCTNLIVSTPNEREYPFIAKNYEGDKYPHLRHYTPPQLDALVKEAGWEVLQRFRQKDKQDPVTHGKDGKFLIYVCS